MKGEGASDEFFDLRGIGAWNDLPATLWQVQPRPGVQILARGDSLTAAATGCWWGGLPSWYSEGWPNARPG
jgi:hypothetical protein